MLVLEKLLLGVSLAAPIGPVSIEMIKQGLTKGFWSALFVRIGGLGANFLCLVISYIGLRQIQPSPVTIQVLSILGGGVLVYMGLKSFSLKKSYLSSTTIATHKPIIQNVSTGFILALVNPIGIMFWLSIFVASSQFNPENPMSGFALNLLILGGVFLWGVFLSLVLWGLKHWVNNKNLVLINNCSSILLICFGIKIALKSFGFF